jgi:glycosyltransferase involved in cell wall biosynthesis
LWNSQKKRLVVVPNDPVALYVKGGFDSYLEGYFNPQKMFREVFALSPLEERGYEAFGMTIVPAPEGKACSILRELSPDVVRAYGGGWTADYACRYRLPNVPVVVSVHDTHPSMVRHSVRFADLILCVSTATEKEVLARGSSPKQIRLLPNRFDRDVFHPISDESAIRSVSQRFPPGKYIFQLGRKVHQKNLDTLLRALAHLPSEYSCIFAGMGDASPYVSLAKELGVEKRCYWIDAIDNSELPLWHAWCDCYCMPSRWEGFSIALVEAAACGAAIVASDIGPMRDLLTHDVSACLVKDYEDHLTLAAAIRLVCEDRVYRRKICSGAIKAAEPFERSIVDGIEAAYYYEAISMGSYSFSLMERAERYIWQQGGDSAYRTIHGLLPHILAGRVYRKALRTLEGNP